MKVMTILGTRPEIIRLSRVMARLDEVLDHVVVHTGQNYDHELNQVFYDDLELRPPDHYLGVDTSSVGRAYGQILIGAEEVILQEQPEAVLILGDTNSSISAIVARRLHVPVFHMEAGNRSFDLEVPEETNRRIIDHTADFNLAYTEHARRNLIAEGIDPRTVYVTGSPMGEVLHHYDSKIQASTVQETMGIQAGTYVVASLHREENVDDPGLLSTLLKALVEIAERHDVQVVMSTHPRTRERLAEIPDVAPESMARISFHPPFGFTDFIRLQTDALGVISDSGTISEESAILGFPAITPRNAMERPEAMDAGTIILSGTEHPRIVHAFDQIIAQHKAAGPLPAPQDYVPTHCSRRVVNLILGLTGLASRWRGVPKPQWDRSHQ